MRKMMMKAFHAIVRGLVQGVAFRYYTRDAAKALGLVGWVRNLPDGTVEVKAEGEQDRLEQLVARLKQGPRLAKVDSVDLSFCEPSGDGNDFDIRL